MPKITFINEKKEVEVPEGTNLRTAAMQNEIAIHHASMDPLKLSISEKLVQYLNCHGLGTCGTCHVHIKKGMENCSAKGTWEKIRLGVATFSIGCEDEVRLSCQTRVNGDIEVLTHPPANLYGENFWS